MSSDEVDAVYTWVDGSDPEWIAERHAALARLGNESSGYLPNGTAESRFHSRDELKYSFRALERHAPFLRRVHLITAGQVPQWLRVHHPDLQLVFHKDLFPDSSHLPSFNSCAIETHLHRVPDLSERFIYLNDDFFIARPVSPESFFDADGRARLYHGKPVRWAKADKKYGQVISRNSRNNSRLLEESFGFRIDRKLAHAPYALQRSIFEELWGRYPKPLEATSSHPFRHSDDLSPASSLAAHYALCTERATSLRESHVDHVKVNDRLGVAPLLAAKLAAHWLLPALRKDFLTINDGNTLCRSQWVNSAIPAFLDRIFPKKSRFEL